MKISIAMATYNGAQYIREQLQSFVEQTRHPDELIITDDCSSDQTEAIVREFSRTAPFAVEFHRNKRNLGYCGNFNAALIRTTGDLVFLSDQDDVWFPEKIEHMVDFAARNPEALVVMNDAELTDSKLKGFGLTKVGQIRSAAFPMTAFVMGCCCGVRRELLNFCMPIPAGFKAHDSWLVRFADGLNAKAVDSRVLQYYRRHESNESHFLANRTSKITKYHAFIELSRSAFASDIHQRRDAQIEQQRLFCGGVERALSLAPNQYQESIIRMLQVAEDILETLEKRDAIRKQSILPRAISTFVLLLKGGYRNTSGLKAVLRDLLG